MQQHSFQIYLNFARGNHDSLYVVVNTAAQGLSSGLENVALLHSN